MSKDGKNIVDRITEIIRAWPQWSRAERSDDLYAVTEEILRHCRQGGGNLFIRRWCEHNLKGVGYVAS